MSNSLLPGNSNPWMNFLAASSNRLYLAGIESDVPLKYEIGSTLRWCGSNMCSLVVVNEFGSPLFVTSQPIVPFGIMYFILVARQGDLRQDHQTKN